MEKTIISELTESEEAPASPSGAEATAKGKIDKRPPQARQCKPCGMIASDDNSMDDALRELTLGTLVPPGGEVTASGPITLDVGGSRKLIRVAIESDAVLELPESEEDMQKLASSATALPSVDPPAPKRTIHSKGIHTRVQDSALTESSLVEEFRGITSRVESRMRERALDLEVNIGSHGLEDHPGLRADDFITPVSSPGQQSGDGSIQMEVESEDCINPNSYHPNPQEESSEQDLVLPAGERIEEQSQSGDSPPGPSLPIFSEGSNQVRIDQTSRGGIVSASDILEDLITKLALQEKTIDSLRKDLEVMRKEKEMLEGTIRAAVKRIQALESAQEKKYEEDKMLMQVVTDIKTTVHPIETWWRESTQSQPLRRDYQKSPDSEINLEARQPLPSKVIYQKSDKEKWLSASQKILSRISPKFLTQEIMMNIIEEGGPEYYFAAKYPRAKITKEMLKNLKNPKYVQTTWESIDTALFTVYGELSKKQYIPSGGYTCTQGLGDPQPRGSTIQEPNPLGESPQARPEDSAGRENHPLPGKPSTNSTLLPWKKPKLSGKNRYE
ncbi:MAG: hypothetical protein FuLiV1_gp2 [Hangzhou acrida cinerea lispivirus 1]|uniref:Uncharacterized protein n=1 Tax=Hangzhou acrida cinerea lispivirus 1 TaxID=2905565 RepID=A0A8K1XCN2_9MONO|nr:MAG: hypothetical protein QKV03_gp2 [Hangzhou acrida cinerea lispivirus 1]UHK03315.1 MAG: hypothetical protein FuLiV1_gp2 [Hangzhou acrida cinerea lispivirus 1]